MGFFKEEVEIGEVGEEGRVSGYILNITDRFTNIIIPMVNPSVILPIYMTHQCTICLFESHCSFVSSGVCKNFHVLVYTFNIFLSVFTDGVSDGKNSISKNHRKISTEKIH
jgi:hypothetical protein